MSVEKEIEKIVNLNMRKFKQGDGATFPDFILARLVDSIMKALQTAVYDRDKWYKICRKCGNPTAPWPEYCSDCKPQTPSQAIDKLVKESE